MRTTIAEYSHHSMNSLWSPHHRVLIERTLWIHVMEQQARLGVPIPRKAISSYKDVLFDGDLDQISEIERKTKHDLRARLEHFNDQAGYCYAHLGLTSCDITDNATLIQIKGGLESIRRQVLETFDLLAGHIQATRDTVCVARTHNQPAQFTLLGKRFATIADELFMADGALLLAINALPFRGMVGAVGTAEDLRCLLGEGGVDQLNSALREKLRFQTYYHSTGQVYHRSDDLPWVSALKQVAAVAANLARLIRLESSSGRMWEHFEDGQVGSSAMPHKKNPINSERICGLQTVVYGFANMIETASWQQWYEGDVSDSITRRIAIPGVFQATDAILRSMVWVLRNLEISRAAVEEDVTDQWHNLKTSELLSTAIAQGHDRDNAYRVIREWASGGHPVNKLDETGLSMETVTDVLESEPQLHEAQAQIQRVLNMIEEVRSHALG